MECGVGDVGRLALGKGQVGPEAREPAREAAREDHEETDVDDIRSEQAEPPLPGHKDGLPGLSGSVQAVSFILQRSGDPVAGRREGESQPEAGAHAHGGHRFGVDLGGRPEGPPPLGAQSGDGANDRVHGEKEEEGQIPHGLIKPGQLERREEPGQAAVAGGVFGRAAALGNEGPQYRGQGDQDEQDDPELDRCEEFPGGSHAPSQGLAVPAAETLSIL